MIDALSAGAWQGNIRELENVIERCVVISSAATLDADVLPEKYRLPGVFPVAAQNGIVESASPIVQLAAGSNGDLKTLFHQEDFSFDQAMTDYKRQLVQTALRECNGSRSEAAQRLHISRQYLHKLINELGVLD